MADSTERKRIKAFRDITRHLDGEEAAPGDYSKSKSSERTRQQLFQEEADEYMGKNRGVSIKKLNDRLKQNVKNVERKERFLLSPPKDQQSVSQAERQVYGRGSISHKNYVEEDLYEDQRYQSDHYRTVDDRTESFYGRPSDRYMENLPVDKKIKELEEKAINNIRNGDLEDALERLILAEKLIKSELPRDDPQQMYEHSVS